MEDDFKAKFKAKLRAKIKDKQDILLTKILQVGEIEERTEVEEEIKQLESEIKQLEEIIEKEAHPIPEQNEEFKELEEKILELEEEVEEEIDELQEEYHELGEEMEEEIDELQEEYHELEEEMEEELVELEEEIHELGEEMEEEKEELTEVLEKKRDAPYGYIREGKKLKIDEEEAKNVRLMFSWFYKNKVPIVKIAEKTGLDVNDIAKIVVDPIYFGKIISEGKVKNGKLEAIIDKSFCKQNNVNIKEIIARYLASHRG